MFIVDFISWWYGSGWAGVSSATRQRIQKLLHSFSTGTLLRTLFAPWRRIITQPGAGLDAHFRAALDNLVSRCVGFTVRLFVLLAAGVSLVLLSLGGVVELIIWPFLPPAAVVLIIWGLV